MKAEEFIDALAEIMDTESALTLDTKLKDVEEWDSLSVVSFLSFCAMKTRRPVMPDEVKSAETVGDLFKLVGES